MIDDEQLCINRIINETQSNNVDNILRTKAYLLFFQKYPEISWAFLASMVSRNGGWNMCDLEGRWFPQVLPDKFRNLLFLTYERANWLIFHDAYPQLLLYHYSTKMGRPMFHLLPYFYVSNFMKDEWNHYWKYRNRKRLMTALIINEQNVIQNPVIEHPVFREKVFHSVSFYFQDWFHFSSVLFPTLKGELFGAVVSGFTRLDNRIELGKRLAEILLEPALFPGFLKFAEEIEHTGSRYDFEQFLRDKKERDTPFLKDAFPVINHQIDEKKDWSLQRKINKDWFEPISQKSSTLLTKWYEGKQKQMHSLINIRNSLS